MAIHGVTFQLTGLEDAQFLHRFQVCAVDESSIDVGGHGVDCDPSAQSALISDTVAGTDEIQTSATKQFVKRVSCRDVDGPASLMSLLGWYVATFRFGIRSRIYKFGLGQKMLKKSWSLSPILNVSPFLDVLPFDSAPIAIS